MEQFSEVSLVKRKIRVLLCMLTVLLMFTGCSAQKSEVEYDTTTMQQTVDVIISSFASMKEEEFNQYKDLSTYQLDYVMMNSGLRIEAEKFVSMIESWEAGEAECGAYVSHGEYKVETTSDGVVISTAVQYENRNATLSFAFSEDSFLESMDVSAKYSLEEIMTKAGLNTVMGMGVVFAVLIFLAILIYLMKYIPKLVDKSVESHMEDKQISTETKVETAAPVATVECVDDLELVAVITAAIAAMEGTSTEGFVVRSIRRRPSNKWR